jgi:hypothetical protein
MVCCFRATPLDDEKGKLSGKKGIRNDPNELLRSQQAGTGEMDDDDFLEMEKKKPSYGGGAFESNDNSSRYTTVCGAEDEVSRAVCDFMRSPRAYRKNPHASV